jgi:hypothetical protein
LLRGRGVHSDFGGKIKRHALLEDMPRSKMSFGIGTQKTKNLEKATAFTALNWTQYFTIALMNRNHCHKVGCAQYI